MASLVSVPGASATVRGGVVAYATALKHSLLGVDAALLAGAGRGASGRRAADGRGRPRDARAIDGRAADVGIATTGVAGPTPQDGRRSARSTSRSSTPAGTRVESLALGGTRARIRAEATAAALARGAGALSVAVSVDDRREQPCFSVGYIRAIPTHSTAHGIRLTSSGVVLLSTRIRRNQK